MDNRAKRILHLVDEMKFADERLALEKQLDEEKGERLLRVKEEADWCEVEKFLYDILKNSGLYDLSYSLASSLKNSSVNETFNHDQSKKEASLTIAIEWNKTSYKWNYIDIRVVSKIRRKLFSSIFVISGEPEILINGTVVELKDVDDVLAKQIYSPHEHEDLDPRDYEGAYNF